MRSTNKVDHGRDGKADSRVMAGRRVLVDTGWQAQLPPAPMYRNFPVLESERTLISAPRYNRVRLALAWLDNPARLELTGMHDLELILNNQTWLCIDTGLGNLPVLAWKEFHVPRGGLHEPVECRVDYYNLHAELIRDRVLEIMDRVLQVRLQRRRAGPRGQVRLLRPTGRRRHLQ